MKPTTTKKVAERNPLIHSAARRTRRGAGLHDFAACLRQWSPASHVVSSKSRPENSKKSCACYGAVPRPPAAWNSTSYPSAAASPCSISDCLASSGRSGQTAIAWRSSHHELRANVSLFASPSYKSAVSPAFVALVRVAGQLFHPLPGRHGMVDEKELKYQACHSSQQGHSVSACKCLDARKSLLRSHIARIIDRSSFQHTAHGIPLMHT